MGTEAATGRGAGTQGGPRLTHRLCGSGLVSWPLSDHPGIGPGIVPRGPPSSGSQSPCSQDGQEACATQSRRRRASSIIVFPHSKSQSARCSSLSPPPTQVPLPAPPTWATEPLHWAPGCCPNCPYSVPHSATSGTRLTLESKHVPPLVAPIYLRAPKDGPLSPCQSHSHSVTLHLLQAPRYLLCSGFRLSNPRAFHLLFPLPALLFAPGSHRAPPLLQDFAQVPPSQ